MNNVKIAKQLIKLAKLIVTKSGIDTAYFPDGLKMFNGAPHAMDYLVRNYSHKFKQGILFEMSSLVFNHDEYDPEYDPEYEDEERENNVACNEDSVYEISFDMKELRSIADIEVIDHEKFRAAGYSKDNDYCGIVFNYVDGISKDDIDNVFAVIYKLIKINEWTVKPC